MPSVGYATLQIIPSVRGISSEIRRQLVPPAEDAGSDAGRAAGNSFGDRFKAGVAAAGVAAGAALVYGVTKAVEKEASGDKLAAQLGLSGSQARRLGKIAGGIYVKGYGESLGQVNDSLRELAQNGVAAVNAPRKQLAGLSKAALNLAATFDVDVADAARAAGQMMRTGLADNGRQAFDVITRGFQTGADKAGDLLDTLNEYSTQFQKIGLTGGQAVGILTQGLRAGARDSDVIADALKEFSLLAVDGSEATAAAFKNLGIDASKFTKQFTKGGKSGQQALDLVFDRLRTLKGAEWQNTVKALFGGPGEDLGKAINAIDVSKATGQLGKVNGAAVKLGKTLHGNTAADIEQFKRQIESKLVNFAANQLIPALKEIAPVVGAALAPVRELWQWLAADPARMQAAATALLVIVGAIAAFKIISGVVGGVRALWGGLTAAGAAARTAGGHIRFAAFAVRYYTTLAALSAKQALRTAAAWVAAQARIAGGWLRAQLAAAGAFARTAAAAVLNAARTATAWVVAQSRSAVATLRATAAMVAQRAAMIASAVATRAMAVAQRLLNVAMRLNPIGLVITALIALGALFVVLWKKSDTFRRIVKGAMHGVMVAVRAVGAAAMWLWKKAIKPAFNFIGDIVMWLWKNVIKRYFALIMWQVRAVGAVAGWLWNKAIKPAFNGIAKVARWLWENVLKKVFDKGKAGVALFGYAFGKAKDAIKRAWDKLKGIARKPIEFIINTVYNKGIVPVWNKIAGAFGADKLSKFRGFARGGILPGMSSWRQGDDQLVPMRRGEGVYVSEAMRNPYERARLHAVNQAAMSGKSLAPYQGGGYAKGGIVGGFAEGGIFEWIGKGLQGVGSSAWDFIKKGAAWLRDTIEGSARAGVKNVVNPLISRIPGVDNGFGRMLKQMPKAMIDAIFGYSKQADGKMLEAGVGGPGTRAALRFARAQAGEPYVWGGVGPHGFDCSGFMGAIQRRIVGENPYARMWSTFAFQGAQAPGGWVRGLKAPFMIGITNAGVGHTAGTLNGVNVESRGGDGVLVGGRARGYNSPLFGSTYGYRPSRKYDDGGWLMPGATAAFNQTGRPEAVLTDPQWRAVRSLAARGAVPSLDGQRLRLVVDDREFDAYVDARADRRVDANDRQFAKVARAGRRIGG